MARRLTFNEFRTAIERRTMPLEELPDYVDFDPNNPVPKLVFRADALIDRPPPGYDVDAEVYRMLRSISEERQARVEPAAAATQKRIVAEGDSWFNLPILVRPPAIADLLERNKRFRTKNIAYWGHTLQRILRDKEYMKVLAQEKPDFFLFSAGGNDLQLGLADGTYIQAYDSTRPLDQYFTKEGEAALAQIEKGYTSLFTELLKFPMLKVICYGYDYPRPLLKGGTYIGRFLKKKGIPDNMMAPIAVAMIDKLNEAIRAAVKQATQSTKISYLDCRRVTEPFTWYDDMHPDRDGFLALAGKFEEAMNRL